MAKTVKLKLDTPVVSLTNKVLKDYENTDATMGKVIASQLANKTNLSNTDTIRAYRIATDFFDTPETEITEDVLDFVIKQVEEIRDMPVLWKGQVQLFLENAKRQFSPVIKEQPTQNK